MVGILLIQHHSFSEISLEFTMDIGKFQSIVIGMWERQGIYEERKDCGV